MAMEKDQIQNAAREPLVDLLWSVMANVAESTHLAELLSAAKYQDNDEDEFNYLNQKIFKLRATRSAKMMYIQNLAENLDPYLWCCVKHGAEAYMTSYEYYLASKDEKFLDILRADEEDFFDTISHWLGFNFTTCGRCFSDQIKAKNYDKIDNVKHNKKEKNGKN